MKRILSIILVMVCALAIVRADNRERPSLSLETRAHDFGTIREADGPVSCAFTFTNTGDAPLVIISANAACGCTNPVIPMAPVAPGETDSICVTFNPAHNAGEFQKNITVRTNDPRNKRITLKVAGVIIPI